MPSYEWTGTVMVTAEDDAAFIRLLRERLFCHDEDVDVDLHTSEIGWFDEGLDRAWKRLVPKEGTYEGLGVPGPEDYIRDEYVLSSTMGSTADAERRYHENALARAEWEAEYHREALRRA